jgi:hypothetical protein
MTWVPTEQLPPPERRAFHIHAARVYLREAQARRRMGHHKRAYNNRWLTRGAVLAPLAAAARITRGGSRGAKAGFHGLSGCRPTKWSGPETFHSGLPGGDRE